jgi:hypothetical protein
VRQIIATTLILTATVAFIAARGKSDPASSTPTSASAINLHAADVPGFSVTRQPPLALSVPLGPYMERCDGGSGNTKEDIGIESQTFKYGETPHPTIVTRSNPIWEVQSAVYVTRNAALAARRVRLAGSAHARDCLKRLIEADRRREVGSNDTNEPFFHKVEVSALPSTPSPLPGVPVYGIRSIFCFALFSSLPCGQRHAFTIQDYLGFAAGTTLVTLHDTGLERAFPSTTERRLLTLLYKRAKAQKP